MTTRSSNPAFEAELVKLRAIIASWTEEERQKARDGVEALLKQIDDEQALIRGPLAQSG